MKKPVAEKFWRKVDKNGPIMRKALGQCWVWTASKNGQGYGIFSAAGHRGGAHRFSWLLAYLEWPALDVLHRCDNPPCVRLDHLFLGDDMANVKDRKEKGREGNHKGTANGRAKLTEENAVEIRARFARGESAASMVAVYGVTLAAIRFVLTRRTWKHC